MSARTLSLLGLLGLMGLWGCETRLEVLSPTTIDASAPEKDASDGPENLGCTACEPLQLCAVNRCVDTAGVTTLRSGLRHACVVQDGRLRCWGNNGSSQLGVDDVVDRLLPTRVGRSEEWLDVAAGQEHTCALHAPGELYCWGENSTGQLGLGDTRPRTRPERIAGPSDFTQVQCGGDNCCALREGGGLYCWGDNHQGVPGRADSDEARDVLEPSAVGRRERYVSASVGEAHACAIDDSGRLWCWGRNSEGQLGVGTTPAQSREPLRVGTDDDYHQVSAGQHHTCAIRGEGELYCWGTNDFFELGLGPASLDDSSGAQKPVRVDAASDWASVAVGWFHTCALKRSGALYCWGRSAEGQLALAADGRPVANPTAVVTEMRFRRIALGSFHTCAMDQQRAVYCWGGNTDGQLGLGDTTARNAPGRVPL